MVPWRRHLTRSSPPSHWVRTAFGLAWSHRPTSSSEDGGATGPFQARRSISSLHYTQDGARRKSHKCGYRGTLPGLRNLAGCGNYGSMCSKSPLRLQRDEAKHPRRGAAVLGGVAESGAAHSRTEEVPAPEGPESWTPFRTAFCCSRDLALFCVRRQLSPVTMSRFFTPALRRSECFRAAAAERCRLMPEVRSMNLILAIGRVAGLTEPSNWGCCAFDRRVLSARRSSLSYTMQGAKASDGQCNL